MRIIFFGTPDFAIPTLEKILKSSHSIEAVVTAPDKQRGRGRKITYTPVKEFAVKNNIPVFQPEKLKDKNFSDELKNIYADIYIVVAFRILPENIFTIPPFGSFNLHGSLLPKYRGAAPIQWALINGETKTGVTTFFLKEKVDTGNIILQKEINILDADNFGSLHDKMSVLGADAVLETLDLIENGKHLELKEQDNSLASPAPKITKEITKISWNKPALEIHNLVRGLSPYPGASFLYNKKNYKVFKTEIMTITNLQPGEIYQTKEEIIIGAEKGAVRILELQPEGRRRMKTEEFLHGYSLIAN